jgi:hypothetical protein
VQHTSSISTKFLGIGLLALSLSLLVYQFEILGVVALFALPLGMGFMFFVMRHPSRMLDTTLVCSFLAIGVIRYVGDIPFGLTVDFSLVLAFVVAIFHRTLKADFNKLKMD